jgi:hypothetical protein
MNPMKSGTLKKGKFEVVYIGGMTITRPSSIAAVARP